MTTFYATIDRKANRYDIPPVDAMFPASSYHDGTRLIKPRFPRWLTSIAADSGGFVASRIWGDYRYTVGQYVRWLDTFGPQWAATMDFCCEDELTSGKPGVVRLRQRRTTDMAWLFWELYRRADWQWVPTIQGWTIPDYVRHARELRPLLETMQVYYGSGWRVGIGTLCRRSKSAFIHHVVQAVAGELPGFSFHLWGVKLDALRTAIDLPGVVSVDSGVWHGARDEQGKAWKRYGKKLDYAYYKALPAYQAKVMLAVNGPKQLTLETVGRF
jgi:hypothetical protein